MVKGLQRFVEHFKGLEETYVLIGGAACDVWLTDRELPFRATNDLDLVIVVEALSHEFYDRFWAFIRDGRYKSHQQSEERPEFYRFREPETADYPFMIELLTRNHLELPGDVHLTPIPADEDISSLSAILLDNDYYQFVVTNAETIRGARIVPAKCLIPLKARAWLDLTARREKKERVKGDDIKKHRNDVFRLYRSLAPDDRFTLPEKLQKDLVAFLDRHAPDSKDWDAIRQAVSKPELPEPAKVLEQLRANFSLAPEAPK